MSFNIGDSVLHKSDKKPRKMVVAGRAFKKSPPDNRHDEFANLGHAEDGSYYCTWILGKNKCEGYFNEAELELQKP
jgi:uncharacterized protein YodC (DUF2158 family)